MTEENLKLQPIGLIGIGEMGLPFARNLLRAGYQVVGFDRKQEQLERFRKAGGQPARDEQDVAEKAQTILLSLPSSSAFIAVAEALLPRLRPGQVVIDTGTTLPSEAERLSKRFADQGVALLDVPVSGGAKGADQARLKLFVGASKEELERFRPLLSAIGGDQMIYHCGGPGKGQAMKGVNQILLALAHAPNLEILAWAQRNGLSLDLVRSIYPDHTIAQTIDRIANDEGNTLGVKFRELPYFIEEARRGGYRLPIVEAIHAFCKDGEFLFFDDHRKAPAFWHELQKKADAPSPLA